MVCSERGAAAERCAGDEQQRWSRSRCPARGSRDELSTREQRYPRRSWNLRCFPLSCPSQSNPHLRHPAAGGKSQHGFICPFFLCSLTDPAPTEVFSDHSALIARGKHFLAIPACPSWLAGRFPWQPGWHQPCHTDATCVSLPAGCSGCPGQAGSARPPSAWHCRAPTRPSLSPRVQPG